MRAQTAGGGLLSAERIYAMERPALTRIVAAAEAADWQSPQ